jgi:hypothetical protein
LGSSNFHQTIVPEHNPLPDYCIAANMQNKKFDGFSRHPIGFKILNRHIVVVHGFNKETNEVA